MCQMLDTGGQERDPCPQKTHMNLRFSKTMSKICVRPFHEKKKKNQHTGIHA